MSDELAEVRRTLRIALKDLESKAARIRTALAALDPDAPFRGAGSRPKGETRAGTGTYTALRKLFATDQDTYTAEELYQRLKEAGFQSEATDQVNAVRSALSKMYAQGEVVRVGRGRYHGVRADNSQDEPTASEAADADDKPLADADAEPLADTRQLGGVPQREPSDEDEPPF